MGWSSDLESGGRRFDSQLPEGRFGVTCSSILDVLECVWEWSGDALDGFGMVSTKMVDGVEITKTQKLTETYVHEFRFFFVP